MKKQHPILNKNVGIATAIGAGLGVVAGGKSQQLVAGVLFGAGIGAIVGFLGNKNQQAEEPAETDTDQKDEEK